MQVQDPEHIYLERIEPSRNMSRYYTMSVQLTLFGELSLVRRWGRIGTSEALKVDTFTDLAALIKFRARLLARKLARNYVRRHQP